VLAPARVFGLADDAMIYCCRALAVAARAGLLRVASVLALDFFVNPAFTSPSPTRVTS
jgi:hypothetical protein